MNNNKNSLSGRIRNIFIINTALHFLIAAKKILILFGKTN